MKKSFLSVLIFVFFYLGSLAISTHNFPVFADEAIYIHWAHAALRDSQYLFLPMTDGKPPLHTWLLMPFQVIIQDPVVAGRMLSWLASLGSVLLFVQIVKILGGNRKLQWLAAFLAAWTPFWFFHAYLALAESVVMFFFCLAFLAGLKLRLDVHKKIWAVVFAFSLGALLWTKTTSLFFIPVFAVFPWVLHNGKNVKLLRWLAIAGGLGCALFLTLRFTPQFPSLFSRSSDYTFSVSQLLQGEWKFIIFTSFPRVVGWLLWYLTLPVVVLALFAPVKMRRFWILSLIYAVPVLALGKVISARYFFPAALPITLLAVFGAQKIVQKHLMLGRKVFRWLVILWILWSGNFVWQMNLGNDTALSQADKKQYLNDWSSGHGLSQVWQYVEGRAVQGNKVTVLTEGYFGSLPDGLSIYSFHSRVANQIRIEGVGVPVLAIPSRAKQALAEGREVYLLVNSTRNKLSGTDLEKVTPIAEYNRASSQLNNEKTPTLQLFRIMKD